MVGTLPTETDTRAYNANNVASVYISSGYGDLVSNSEARVGQTSVFESDVFSLQNGVYGMSDPANLQGYVERFEAELMPGGTSKSMYRLRLINPTDELELFLFGIYNSVFPQDKSSWDIYKEAVKYNKSQETVNAVNDEDDALGALLKRGTQLPFLYLRWGYGSNPDEGLSRIHKCVLYGCDYQINANQDKVVELHLMDWFSSMAENNTFNIRPYLTRQNCLDNNKQLKRFDVILRELIVKYTGVFKGVITLFEKDTGNIEKLNQVATTLAIARWKNYQQYKKESNVGQPLNYSKFLNTSSTVSVEDAADAVINPDASDIAQSVREAFPEGIESGLDFSTTDSLTEAHQCWLSAYADVFQFLGITLRSDSALASDYEPVPVAFDNENNIPDGRSLLGQAYSQLKKTTNIQITDIGVLDFLIPVYEVPDFISPLVVQDPNIQFTPTVKMQSFDTPRAINYNPGVDMQLEQKNALGYPLFPGFLVNGDFDANGNDKPNILDTYSMTFEEFENIVINLKKLQKVVVSGKNISYNSPEFEFLPFMCSDVALVGPAQPKFTIRVGIPYQSNACVQDNYLLYSPLAARETIIPPEGDEEYRSYGAFQTKGLYTQVNNSGFLDTKRGVVLPNDFNITDFNLFAASPTFSRPKGARFPEGDSYSTSRKIRLVPSPASFAKIFAFYTKVQAKVLTLSQQEAGRNLPGNIGGQRIGNFERMLLETLSFVGLGEDPENLPEDIRDVVGAEINHTVEASLGTGKSTTPHITSVLINVINGVNKLVVGEKSPYAIQQIDLNSVTTKEFENLFIGGGVLEQFSERKENLQADRPTILIISRQDSIKNMGAPLTPVKSFPEITRTDPGYEDHIFLSYGEKDSIVTDLRFMGDVRVLYNIPQAMYATLQFASLIEFFETATQEETNNIVQDLMVFVFENKAAELLLKVEKAESEILSNDPTALDNLSEAKEEITKLTNIKNVKALDFNIQSFYFDKFPELIAEYTDDQLREGGFNVVDARKVVSVLSTKAYAELLFPVKNVVYPKDNFEEFSREVNNFAVWNDKENAHQTRQLDVAFFNQELAALEKASMDAKMNFVRDVQDEVWQVEISTLGIPELDIMGAEFFQRIVTLQVNSPRGGQQNTGVAGYHWLSGDYNIVGIRHTLEPNSGYITTLSLTRNPQSLLRTY